MVITFDGPSASGKGTIALALAHELDLYYLDTGLLYRAVAYLLAEKYGIDDEGSCVGPFKIDERDLDVIDRIAYVYRDDDSVIEIDGYDATEVLRSHHIGQLASIVSANKAVRERLLPVLRSIAHAYDIIADGRDCGTVVFPDADLKFYLTASLDVRAQRVMYDQRRGESGVDFETIKREVAARDERDKNREVAPLRKPDDAIVIDNSKMTIGQTVEVCLEYIQDKVDQ